MTAHPLDAWHQVVEERNAAGLDALLADEVVFYSPVVYTPQVGKPITAMYLAAALHVFGNDTFRYVREVRGEHDAVLEFLVEIDGVSVNGVDMIRWNDRRRRRVQGHAAPAQGRQPDSREDGGPAKGRGAG